MLSDRDLQTLRNQGNEAEAAADEIAGLRRQVSAARALIAGADERAIHLSRELGALMQRASDVAGEREANAILTAENERLRGEHQVMASLLRQALEPLRSMRIDTESDHEESMLLTLEIDIGEALKAIDADALANSKAQSTGTPS